MKNCINYHNRQRQRRKDTTMSISLHRPIARNALTPSLLLGLLFLTSPPSITATAQTQTQTMPSTNTIHPRGYAHPTAPLLQRQRLFSPPSPFVLGLRGGDTTRESATETEADGSDGDGGVGRVQKRRRKRRKSARATSVSASDSTETSSGSASGRKRKGKGGRKVVDEAMQIDAATAMGDAIRARSKDLLQDDLTPHHPNASPTFNPSAYSSTFTSLRYALGSSDHPSSSTTIPSSDVLSGSVPAASGAVIANYFLQSHGGAHSIQSITSILAVLQGFAALFLLPSIQKKENTMMIQNLIRRCLLCGMAKHLSGLVALACEGGCRLREVGWNETQRRFVGLVEDPIAQYLCYCALLFVWMASGVGSKFGGVTPSSWWMGEGGVGGMLALCCILGPVLLREVVSTLWVISDVLVLLHSSSLSSDRLNDKNTFSSILSVGHATVDALMSLLLGPDIWRNASAPERQRLLAKLVGRISLAFEVGTAVLLLIDSGWGFLQFSLLPKPSTGTASTDTTTMMMNTVVRPNVLDVGRRLLCARLYVNFMLVRKRKIRDLMGSIRGGYVPGKFLDTLLEPGRAMGLDWDERRRRTATSGNSSDGVKDQTPLERVLFLMGF